MRLILIIGIVLSAMFSNAQTFCTKIVPIEEELITTTEKVMTKEAITSWEQVYPAVCAQYETVVKTIIVSEGYDKLTKKIVNGCAEWCIEHVPAVTEKVVEIILIKKAQAPVYKLVVVSPAVYKTLTITKKIRDGKVVITNAQCD